MLEIALRLLNKINDFGYKAYIVGGFVRDHLLGLESMDIDICTNATPRELREIFEEGLECNDDYGTVNIIYHNIMINSISIAYSVKICKHYVNISPKVHWP